HFAAATDLSDQGRDLGRAGVNPDEERLPVQATSRGSRGAVRGRVRPSLQEVATDEGDVLEDAQPEGEQGDEVQVDPKAVADKGERHGHQGVGHEPGEEDAVAVLAVELGWNGAA